MKHIARVSKWLAAAALAAGVPGFSSAATIDLTGLGWVQYGDGMSFSMPIANYQYGYNTNNGPYAIDSQPGQIQDLIVVATGSSGTGVTTNVAGIESAYATPSGVAGSTYCSTATCPLNSGTTGTITNANALTWDANLASLKTFLGSDQMVFFFNNNQLNAGGDSLQSLASWARITITNAANQVIATFDLTNNGGKYSIVTAGGGGVAFGDPTTYNAPNPTAAPGTYNPLAGSNAATDYILSGGAICVATGLGPVPVPVPCNFVPPPGVTVSAPISHNLGADHVAYAVLVPELNALLASLFGSLSNALLADFTMHVDFRMGCDPNTLVSDGNPLTDSPTCTEAPYGRSLNNGFEQIFIGTALVSPPQIPEPGIIALLALGLLGMVGMRNVNRRRKF